MPDFQLLIDLVLRVGVWGQEWNPWPHAYTASTLPAELFTQPSSYFFF